MSLTDKGLCLHNHIPPSKVPHTQNSTHEKSQIGSYLPAG